MADADADVDEEDDEDSGYYVSHENYNDTVRKERVERVQTRAIRDAV